MNKKIACLEEIILNKKAIAVCLSGGIDSITLLSFCVKILGKKNVFALCAKMQYSFDKELLFAKEISKQLGVKFKIIDIKTPKEILRNPVNKCYFCKKNIFKILKQYAKKNGFNYIADGSNYSDLSDFRPGMKALNEEKILSPFIEAKLEKKDIIKLAKTLNIKNKFIKNPPNTCVLTRIKTGICFDNNLICKIKNTENILAKANFSGHRARTLNGSELKIELSKNDFNQKKISSIIKILPEIKLLNWENISLSLLPYQKNSMNEIFSKK